MCRGSGNDLSGCINDAKCMQVQNLDPAFTHIPGTLSLIHTLVSCKGLLSGT